MIRVQQVKVPLKHQEEDIIKKAAKICKIDRSQILKMEIVKQSLDARRKNELSYVYTVDLEVANQETILKRIHDNRVLLAKRRIYKFPDIGKEKLYKRPIIIGAGPAGLFCAYALAKAGYAPLVLERGKCVEERIDDVLQFWQTGKLISNSNVQFGEGGAGTFSDGKLNTLVKDPLGRNREVLETFVKFGADSELLYINRPHIGTDILCTVISNMRNEIRHLGGEIRFLQEVTKFEIKEERVIGVELNHTEQIAADVTILAIGHSARDTFECLEQQGIFMEAKAFAVGFRIEHPQDMINDNQYQGADMRYLRPASYKLTANYKNGRGVYSFCMCPGGYVVNASSEEGRLAVNGMSYHNRGSANANSAIIISVTPNDFAGQGALSGITFQRKLEEKAYKLGNGSIPQQLYGDFVKNTKSHAYGDFESMTKGTHNFANLRELLPEELNRAWMLGIEDFSKRISNYNRYDAILSGVESRTSSPVRIHRDEFFESNKKGLYPCGEGAGYAGGIMSAAMDGLKVAEAVAGRYTPCFD